MIAATFQGLQAGPQLAIICFGAIFGICGCYLVGKILFKKSEIYNWEEHDSGN